jgi:hypothetical protein
VGDFLMAGNASQPSAATPTYPAPAGGGNVSTLLGVTGTKLVKVSAGAVVRAIVTVAGSGAGGVYDCTATASAVTANQIAVLPAAVGAVDIQFPCLVGIFVIAGSGQQVALSYE